MIVRTYLKTGRIWTYVRTEIIVTTMIALGVVLLRSWGVADLAVSFLPLGVFGTAIAIVIGFRNNTAYARWWEARSAWGTVLVASRQYARLVVTFVRSHAHLPSYDAARADAFIRAAVMRQIAWVHTLRASLRGEALPALDEHVSADEAEAVRTSVNPCSTLLVRSGTGIYDAMANGTLQGFDSFQLEGCLAQLQSAQAVCERIKGTPLPRQFGFFTTVFLWIVLGLTPFCLLSVVPAERSWAVVALSVVVAFAFTILDKAGRVTEDPFEGRIQDVPMTAIAITIERELREIIGDTKVLPAPSPVDGILM
jgi:putative membrane protein